MRTAAFLILAAAAPALALDEPPGQAKLDDAHRMLDYGLWNGRIDALYDLGALGRDGLGELTFADDDADWQVRLTAVHFLGKLGAPAAPALAAVAEREPCPHVRRLALLWLKRMGPDGAASYRRLAQAEDEEALASLPPGYSPEVMGKPLVVDTPDGMTPEFFDGGVDLRACASSEHAGRLHRAGAAPSGPGDGPERDEVVKTPEIPAWARNGGARPSSSTARAGSPETLPPGPAGPERPDGAVASAPLAPADARVRGELDGLLAPGPVEALKPLSALLREQPVEKHAPRDGEDFADLPPADEVRSTGTPESLPAGPPAPERAPSAPDAAPAFAVADPRRAPAAAVAARSTGTPESFPPGLPAPEPRAVEPGRADLVADAGTGKPENDPIPVLIAALSSAEPRRRARAADELGKRGDAAKPALTKLRAATKDRDRRVRASAVLALGSVAAADAARDIRRALKDRDEDVRFSAALALERLRSRTAPAPRTDAPR